MEPEKRTDWRFRPGEGGRHKGIPNKLTSEKKQRLERIVEILEEHLEDTIKKLKPKEQVDLWMGLQEYVRPKLQRMNIDVNQPDEKLTKITFEIVHTTVLPEKTIKTLPIGDESQGIRSIPEKL